MGLGLACASQGWSFFGPLYTIELPRLLHLEFGLRGGKGGKEGDGMGGSWAFILPT